MKRISFDSFTHWKGKATGRKGMGMELALLVLFVVFACSILLVSSAMLGKRNLNDRKDQMIERFALDMLAEKALAEPSAENRNFENEYYKVTCVDNTLVITDKESSQVKLTVTWDGSNKITAWEYG